MNAPPAIRRETEADLQRAVTQLARILHWHVWHLGDARKEVSGPTGTIRTLIGDRDAAGIPDLILARERVIWIELKDARGKLRPAQERWRDALLTAGQEWYLWRPSDFSDGLMQEALTRRAR